MAVLVRSCFAEKLAKVLLQFLDCVLHYNETLWFISEFVPCTVETLTKPSLN